MSASPDILDSAAPQESRKTLCPAPFAPSPFLYRAPLRVGLLGGSFNPAHDGHIHLSLQALMRLRLDYVWWLVTPLNPHKRSEDMADYQERLHYAQTCCAPHRRIHVTALEAHFRSPYSCDTISQLKRHYPHLSLVWLMGADNLACLHRWHRWQSLVRQIPIAVFTREPYMYAALHSPAAHALQLCYSPAPHAIACTSHTPRLYVVPIRSHPGSATAIRRGARQNAHPV